MAFKYAADQRKAENAVDEVEQVAQVVQMDALAQIRGERAGMLTVYGCPDCGGVLWQVPSDGFLQFRCHIGHMLSAQTLLEQQFSAVEAAGWAAVRALVDHSRLLRQMSLQAQGEKDAESAAQLEARAVVVEGRAAAFRTLMEAGD